MSDKTELLPCPWCGGESFVRIDISLLLTQSRYRVGCDKDPSCHGWYGHSRYYATEAEAIAAWNARAERTCEEIVRCRDCAKADYAEVHMFDGTRQKKWTCTRFGCFHHMVQPDGFCSRGARREP